MYTYIYIYITCMYCSKMSVVPARRERSAPREDRPPPRQNLRDAIHSRMIVAYTEVTTLL